ncbi:hypothetical protein [Elioraea sp.]|uniref:hypothetical protein n=1 Tax=Elioraea sp. TaxID=2185103 RepID=UPI00307F8EF1
MRLRLTLAAAAAATLLGAVPALADPPWARGGWHGHRHHHHGYVYRPYRPPVVVVPPPVYYAPPPVIYAPPPAVVYGYPRYRYRPPYGELSIGLSIPLGR